MLDFPSLFMAQVQASTQVQFVYDIAAGQVVFVNAAYGPVLLGTNAGVNAELPALLARIHPDDQAYLAEHWARWMRGEQLSEIEVRLQRVGESAQWFAAIPYYHVGEAGGPLLVCTLHDISAAKHHQANSDLFNSRKNVTLEVLSHDASGAFIMVEQLAQYLREELPEAVQPQVAQMLTMLENTSRESVKMIRDLINLEFTAAVATNLKVDRVDLGDIMRGPLAQLQLGYKLLGHHFTYSLPAEAVYVNLDVSKFTQVVINLVSNAMKFTRDEGYVQVTVTGLPDRARVQVADDGIGIPAAMLPHVFERFTRARRLGLRGEETIGLGLSLCKTIVEWHEGTLSVSSVEGKGSVFTVEIPLAEGALSRLPDELVEAAGF
ncbi:PAS domain-containing sensor histidine kinase [Hymenobacter yonginensis]|uniref:histidine kinase n=1 Tax=Hymenobacter yonginensis TaxID=748197 RepID=A0ABY7PV61_9BACT|nr:ATP-binding protein [Hymenobacter yonginensis]WBO86542.1 ATP-binding protein [Hymenobacter yonginensis]